MGSFAAGVSTFPAAFCFLNEKLANQKGPAIISTLAIEVIKALGFS